MKVENLLNIIGAEFYTGVPDSQLKALCNCLMSKYGIDPGQVHPHAFRHLFAKNFLQKNNDIALLADLLGRSSIETTRIYLQQSSREQGKMVDEIVDW